MRFIGMNGDTTKHINRQQVLRLLSREPGISRTEISNRMGLVKMTVSNIIAEMLRNGMISETESSSTARSGAGRKLTGLHFSETSPVVAGIHIIGDLLAVGIFSMDLQLLSKVSHSITEGDVAEQAAAAVASLAKTAERPLIGVGLALGAGWEPSVRFRLEKLLNTPVVCASNTAADAAAVSRFSDHERFICLSIAPTGPDASPDGGVRASAVIGGTLLGDSDGLIPLGQMNCGKDRLAAAVSIPAVCRQINDILKTDCRTLSDVQAACQHPVGKAALGDILAPLSNALSDLALTVYPEALIVDSDLAGLGELLRPLRKNIPANSEKAFPVISAAEFSEDTTLCGAGCLVLNQVFDGKLGYEFFFGN